MDIISICANCFVVVAATVCAFAHKKERNFVAQRSTTLEYLKNIIPQAKVATKTVQFGKGRVPVTV